MEQTSHGFCQKYILFVFAENAKIQLFAIVFIGVIFLGNYSYFRNNKTLFMIFGGYNNMTTNTTYTRPKYVSLCGDTFNSRRTGNLMFSLAALLYVAKYSGRKPVLPEHMPHGWLNGVFDTSLQQLKNSFIYNKSLSIELHERFGPMMYDPQFKTVHSNATYAEAQILLICGYFESFHYPEDVRDDLKKHFIFKNLTINSVNNFIQSHLKNLTNFSTVGLHVRRTDFLASISQNLGLTVVDEIYINHTVSYFVNFFKNVDKLVVFACSDDISWVKAVVVKLQLERILPNINFVYSTGHDTAFDLCLLSKSDGIIISTGTFSWWAAWLANTTTIYYSLYPRSYKSLGLKFNPRNYYLPTWIGMQ